MWPLLERARFAPVRTGLTGTTIITTSTPFAATSTLGFLNTGPLTQLLLLLCFVWAFFLAHLCYKTKHEHA